MIEIWTKILSLLTLCMKNSSRLILLYWPRGFTDAIYNREQEDEQDKEVEKLHLAAVQGELRLKRNRGVGVDDSDEESDNEDNERARRAMKKLRTTDRGDIKELGTFSLCVCVFISMLNMIIQRVMQIPAHLPIHITKASKMMTKNSHILRKSLSWKPPLIMQNTRVMTMRKSRKKRTNHRNLSRLMRCEDSCVSGLKRRYI